MTPPAGSPSREAFASFGALILPILFYLFILSSAVHGQQIQIHEADSSTSSGFCGTAGEFPSRNTPRRPSCEVKGQQLSRVVGYFEEWAISRPGAFYPEGIPRGVYTHLHSAYAVINPRTLELQPADSKASIKFYRRLNGLKMADPNVKTFISVGGWLFDDNGLPHTTFSDVVRSTENMDKFIFSAIKFLQQYSFDGIDLDWQYPVVNGGRAEDFKNFPIFVRRLKNSLKAIGRDGISVAVPASCWYLQHFDLKRLEPYVDFFNVKAYELHGTWNRGNKWAGPYLNAHANLTELRDSMDLFWHSGIAPSKLNFGMAFFGRALTMSDPSCNTPGCEYISGAPKQWGSRQISLMFNYEIVDLTCTHGTNTSRPVLHKEEAVNSLTFDNNWVTYDDEETLKMRVDFARSQCLGGVMVFAVSQDTSKAIFSKAVGEAAGRPAWKLV